MKRLTKLLITDYKKVIKYGDMHHISENERYHPYVGKRLIVKLFGLFWITYAKTY